MYILVNKIEYIYINGCDIYIIDMDIQRLIKSSWRGET